MTTNPLDELVGSAVQQSQPANTAAARRKRLAVQLIDASVALPVEIVNRLNDSLSAFWSADDPQKLVEELDRNRPGFTYLLFVCHRQLRTVVEQSVPSLSDKLLNIPATYNVAFDHDLKTVTITEIEEEAEGEVEESEESEQE